MAWSSHIARVLGQVAAAIALGTGIATADGGVAGHAATVNARWTSLPLRDVADQLTRLSGVPIVVDRRIDPTTRITLEANNLPLDEVARQLAGQAGAAAAILGSSIRVAPAAAAASCLASERLRDRDHLPAAQRDMLEAPAPWSWKAGARPRDLVAAAAAEQSLAVVGLDLIPHDHFPAAALPPLSLSERLDLILAHFDLRVDWSPGPRGASPRGRIMTMPAGEPMDVQALHAPAGRPQRRLPAKVGVDQPVFTMRAAAPLDDLLGTVAKQLGLALDLDINSLEAHAISPREIVRITVENASRDALLDSIVEPLGLEWAIDDGHLRVHAAHSRP